MNPKALLAAILVVVLAGGLFLYSYLNADSAEEASVSAAVGGEDPSPADDAGVEGAVEPALLDDVTGTWTVSTDIGTFEVLDATSTFVGFRVDEELRNVGAVEAVGRTPVVSGELVIDGTTLTAATIEGDFTQMDSDRSQRIGAMKRAMGVDANPTGVFVLTQPVDFGEIPAPGDQVTFLATGELTVNGVTQLVTLDMEAGVDDGNIIVAGATPVVFADFDIEAPTAGPVVSVSQEGVIEVQVWFTRAR